MKTLNDAYHHGDLRHALVEAATALIEEGGEEAFSLREAARRVGVSANAAYRHFADRSALLTAVAAEGFARLQRRMLKAQRAVPEACVGDTLAVARFKAVGRAYVEFAIDASELFRVMFGKSGLQCLSGTAAQLPSPTPYEVLGQALDALVAERVLPADRREGAELKAWTVVHGFASLVQDGVPSLQKRAQRKRALEALLDFAVAGL